MDVQDPSGFNNVITYYQEIIGYLKEYSPTGTINVLVNKVDPGMELNAEIRKLVETFSEKLTELAKPLPVRAYPTSIFNPLSIIRAFSKPSLGNSYLI